MQSFYTDSESPSISGYFLRIIKKLSAVAWQQLHLLVIVATAVVIVVVAVVVVVVVVVVDDVTASCSVVIANVVRKELKERLVLQQK